MIPEFQLELVARDASNKGKRKFFRVVIQYISSKNGTCNKIWDSDENLFEDSASIKLWKNHYSYGADNVSVKFGVYNSVFRRLKETTKI